MAERDILVAASEEARIRYNGDWDPYEEQRVDDWGYSEAERRAFVAGALFAHRWHRVVTTPIDDSEIAAGRLQIRLLEMLGEPVPDGVRRLAELKMSWER